MTYYNTRLSWIPARALRGLCTPLPDGMTVCLDPTAFSLHWMPLCLSRPAALDVTDKAEGAPARLYQTTLTAAVAGVPVGLNDEPPALLARQADGTALLIGLDFAPHPLATLSRTAPDRPGERAGEVLTVTWLAPWGALRTVTP